MIQQRVILRILCCLVALGFILYANIDKQNQVTALKIRIPIVAKAIKELNEENVRIQYDIDRFENPENLMRIAMRKEYAYLKHPIASQIISIDSGPALVFAEDNKPYSETVWNRFVLALVAKK